MKAAPRYAWGYWHPLTGTFYIRAGMTKRQAIARCREFVRYHGVPYRPPVKYVLA